MGLHKAFATELNNVPIESATEILVAEYDLATDAWAEITVPDGADCKGAFLRTRSGDDFKLSHLSDGSKYITMPGTGHSIAVAKLEGATLCYAQATVTGTLEVLFWY